MNEKLGGLVVFIVYLVVISGIGYMFYLMSTTECDEHKKVVSFVQAVGHRRSTEYIYKLENGFIFETNQLLQIGTPVCTHSRRT